MADIPKMIDGTALDVKVVKFGRAGTKFFLGRCGILGPSEKS